MQFQFEDEKKKKWLVTLSNRPSIHIRLSPGGLKPPDWWRIDMWRVQHQINARKEKKKELFPDASHPKQQNYCKVTGRTVCIHLQVF